MGNQSLVFICLPEESHSLPSSSQPELMFCLLGSGLGLFCLQTGKPSDGAATSDTELLHVRSTTGTRRLALGGRGRGEERKNAGSVQSAEEQVSLSRDVLQSQGNVNSSVCWPRCPVRVLVLGGTQDGCETPEIHSLCVVALMVNITVTLEVCTR